MSMNIATLIVKAAKANQDSSRLTQVLSSVDSDGDYLGDNFPKTVRTLFEIIDNAKEHDDLSSRLHFLAEHEEVLPEADLKRLGELDALVGGIAKLDVERVHRWSQFKSKVAAAKAAKSII